MARVFVYVVSKFLFPIPFPVYIPKAKRKRVINKIMFFKNFQNKMKTIKYFHNF